MAGVSYFYCGVASLEAFSHFQHLLGLANISHFQCEVATMAYGLGVGAVPYTMLGELFTPKVVSVYFTKEDSICLGFFICSHKR